MLTIEIQIRNCIRQVSVILDDSMFYVSIPEKLEKQAKINER